jgi:phosphate transport system permease protein
METSAATSYYQNDHRWRKIKNVIMSSISIVSAVLIILPLGLVLFHLVYEGASSMNWNFFVKVPAPAGEPGGGMANAIVGTGVLLLEALLIGAPVGILGGIFLSEYGNGRMNGAIRFTADVLNGVPSIVWGILGYALIVVPMKGFSALAGGIALGCMMVPLVLRTTEEVLALVPNSYREAAFALGIPRWKIIIEIVVRTAMKGIITGVLLALARIAGETAPLLFTAFGNLSWCHGINQPIAAMPLQIYNYATSPYEDWHRQAWAGALVLITMIFLMNAAVRFLTREKR